MESCPMDALLGFPESIDKGTLVREDKYQKFGTGQIGTCARWLCHKLPDNLVE